MIPSLPSNPYLPYTQDFNEYKNLQINTPEMEIKPALNALEFKEECEKWCKNSVDCGGFSHTIGNDGRAECKYYRTDDIKNMKLENKYEDLPKAFYNLDNLN